MKKEELKHARQYKTWMNQNHYVAVPMSFCTRFNLTPTELLVYCHIKQATEHAPMKTFSGSIKSLCVLCNVSMPTARKAVDKLENEGFIFKEYRGRILGNGTRVETTCYTANDLKDDNKTFEEVLMVKKFMNERRKKEGYVYVNKELVKRQKI